MLLLRLDVEATSHTYYQSAKKQTELLDMTIHGQRLCTRFDFFFKNKISLINKNDYEQDRNNMLKIRYYGDVKNGPSEGIL